MAGVTQVACLLSSELDRPHPDSDAVTGLLAQLCDLLENSTGAAEELDELILDMHVSLVHAATTSAAAEQHVRRLLAAAAQRCTAREVFTLCMSTLAQQLSCRHGGAPAEPGHGPSSPAFHLFLLDTLQRCLPRIRRRSLHFLADLLHMQLRWGSEVLPSLPLSEVRSAAAAAEAASTLQGPVTVTQAVAALAGLAVNAARWVQQAGEQQQQQQLSGQEQQAGRQLVATTLLQLASLTLQLPQTQAAATQAVQIAVQLGAAPAGPALRVGSRLPIMKAAADGLLLLPRMLLRQMPSDLVVGSTSSGGSSGGSGGGGSDGGSEACCPNASTAAGSSTATASAPCPEDLRQLATTASSQLPASGMDPADLAYFSATEAAEGAAVAACAATLFISESAQGSAGMAAPVLPVLPELQARRLQELLPQAACLLLDLGAQHQSVPLSLLPLCAVCRAGAAVAAAGAACQLSASSPYLDRLLAALVAIMSHNPVQLVRSCAHDALQALLDAFQPAARLAQLRGLMQMPSTAAAVVALQRLRQEMAAAWAAPEPATEQGQQEGGVAAAGSLPAAPPAEPRHAWVPQPAAAQGQQQIGGTAGGLPAAPPAEPENACAPPSLWLSAEALQLALPCLEHGSAVGWRDEASVAQGADVQAASLSLLRWVLLRNAAAAATAAAPSHLLPPPQAARLLQHDLLPLRACVLRTLQMQAQVLRRPATTAPSSGKSSGSSAQQQQYQLDSFLAVQRLQEALDCTIDLLERQPRAG